jgi:signal recognition particle subunit SRP9
VWWAVEEDRRSAACSAQRNWALQRVVRGGMVYVDSFSEFQDGAQRIFAANPGGTRYSIKYRHTEGKLVLKVTDDVACLKFKTDQQQDVKRMEKLNMEMFRLMILGADGEVDEAAYAAARGGAMPSPSRTPSKRRR